MSKGEFRRKMISTMCSEKKKGWVSEIITTSRISTRSLERVNVITTTTRTTTHVVGSILKTSLENL